MRLRRDGYVAASAPDHPRAKKGEVLAHILVVEKAMGHYLLPRARVHHVNNDKSDNRAENLVVCQDQAYHMLLHVRQRALRACGDPSFRRCPHCKRYGDPGEMEPHRSGFVHLACRQKYAREWKARRAQV